MGEDERLSVNLTKLVNSIVCVGLLLYGAWIITQDGITEIALLNIILAFILHVQREISNIKKEIKEAAISIYKRTY